MSVPTGKRKLPPPSVLKNEPNWPWIKRLYRAGQMSTREIARRSTAKGQKISHVAIEKRAGKEGWTDDLAADVRRRLHEKLVNSATKDDATDEEIVEAAAKEGVSIVQTHRTDIRSARTIGRMLREQLNEATRDVAELEKAATEEVETDKDAKVREARRARLLKLIGLPSRASIYRDLMQAERIAITLERQAFNIDARHEGSTLEDYLKALDD